MKQPSDERAVGDGCLILAATPIGNVGDASPRLVEVLTTADLIAAEDTRRLGTLCKALDVKPNGRVLSYYEHNEEARSAVLVNEMLEGRTVLLVTDAGMPSISDPGYRLVRACVEAGVRVTAVPGPSAVLTAVALSGLSSERFSFEGFPPRKAGERLRFIDELSLERRTMVFFESPHRTAATLAAMSAGFGESRPAAVCRELTKTFEEVVRGPLSELATWAAQQQVRGEICIVVEGAPELTPTARQVDDLVGEAVRRTAAGEHLREVVAELAAPGAIGKRQLYEAVIAARATQSKV